MVKLEEFKRRFSSAIDQTVRNAADDLGRPMRTPTQFEDLFRETHGHLVPLDEAAKSLYLGDDLSFVFIGVAVRIGDLDKVIGWVRPSGHQPRPYDQVWDAQGTGPFKATGGIGTAAEWDRARHGN
jgi:hypothetical protein